MKLILDIDPAELRQREFDDDPAVVAVMRDAADQIERHLGYDPDAVRGKIRDNDSNLIIATWELDTDDD